MDRPNPPHPPTSSPKLTNKHDTKAVQDLCIPIYREDLRLRGKIQPFHWSENKKFARALRKNRIKEWPFVMVEKNKHTTGRDRWRLNEMHAYHLSSMISTAGVSVITAILCALPNKQHPSSGNANTTTSLSGGQDDGMRN